MKGKIELTQRVQFIKELCRDKKVLHLGCTNYPYTESSLKNDDLLHFELLKTAQHVTGFDFDQSGLDLLAEKKVENLYRADLENLDQLELDETFDVIVAGEIIEHLSNPALFLRGIKRFMSEKTILLITTINAYCALRFIIYAFRGKGGKNEPVHPDHVSYYSYSTLSLVLKRENFTIENFLFYDLGPEHRPHNRFFYNWINDFCVFVSPQLADGVIVECKLEKTSNATK